MNGWTHKTRALIVVVGISLTFSVLGVRLFELHVLQHKELAAQAQANRETVVHRQGRRGEILDANGNLLYPQINGGAGIAQDLSGHKLPNSPHWTMNFGAQYGYEFAGDWKATIRGDAYWQSQSWARVYNAVNDKLHGWYNVNLSLWIERPRDGLKIEIYAKNLLDKTPITDSFINSDDSDLTTNVFVLDPRLIGFSVTKTF